MKSPLQKYSHLTGDNGYLTAHLHNAFHEDCATKVRAFVSVTRSGTGDVAQQLDSVAAAQRQRNRRALERIIVAVEFHGRLGLPLRGHRDCGELPLPERRGTIDYSQGIDCNDESLKEHLMTTGRNATYISPASQNHLLDAISTVIRRHIAAEVGDATYFSIMADETTDFARQEQLAVCLRYVRGHAVIERFLTFELAPDLTGRGLAT